jgi:hypothetical protein
MKDIIIMEKMKIIENTSNLLSVTAVEEQKIKLLVKDL